MRAYIIFDSGKKWLRIIDSSGFEHEESISDYEEIVYLSYGYSTYRNKFTGLEIKAI